MLFLKYWHFFSICYLPPHAFIHLFLSFDLITWFSPIALPTSSHHTPSLFSSLGSSLFPSLSLIPSSLISFIPSNPHLLFTVEEGSESFPLVKLLVVAGGEHQRNQWAGCAPCGAVKTETAQRVNTGISDWELHRCRRREKVSFSIYATFARCFICFFVTV